MKYLKTYEGVFYSKELLQAMYELLRKHFNIQYYWKGTGIRFTTKISVLNFSFITIDKKKDFIEINFNNAEDIQDLEFVVNDIIDKLSEIITLKNKEIGHRFDTINFSIWDYNKVVNFIKNYPTENIEMYFDAKNFNL